MGTKRQTSLFFSYVNVHVEYLDVYVSFRISIEVRKLVRNHKGRTFRGGEIQCDDIKRKRESIGSGRVIWGRGGRKG